MVKMYVVSGLNGPCDCLRIWYNTRTCLKVKIGWLKISSAPLSRSLTFLVPLHIVLCSSPQQQFLLKHIV